MRQRIGWRAAVVGVLFVAGCAAEGEAPAPDASMDTAAVDTTAVAPAVLSPGLPDTIGLSGAPQPSPGLPADVPTAEPSAGGAPPAPRASEPGGWTAGIVEERRSGVEMTTLIGVRSARNEGYDRVVFQFAGDTLPGYHLEYVDRPVRACGSGDAVPMAGDGWLEVRLEPARAHDDSGRATVADRARRPDLPNLLDLRSTCDFEGQVVWVLGVDSPNRYRVLELRDPARLVVDVRHE